MARRQLQEQQQQPPSGREPQESRAGIRSSGRRRGGGPAPSVHPVDADHRADEATLILNPPAPELGEAAGTGDQVVGLPLNEEECPPWFP